MDRMTKKKMCKAIRNLRRQIQRSETRDGLGMSGSYINERLLEIVKAGEK